MLIRLAQLFELGHELGFRFRVVETDDSILDVGLDVCEAFLIGQSPRTEAAQPPQCMLGTLRVYSPAAAKVVAAAPAAVVVLLDSGAEFDAPVQPARASSPTTVQSLRIIFLQWLIRKPNFWSLPALARRV